jgi:hypothetical protein
VESILIVGYLNYINQAYCSYVQYFFDGRKAECVESVVFDMKGQARESGMQVLQQCYFILQG